MAGRPKKEEKFQLDLSVPYENKSDDATAINLTVNVVAGMRQIQEQMPVDKIPLLDEYAKLYLLKRAGVETYPLKRI